MVQGFTGFSQVQARSVLLDFGLHYGQSEAVGTPATQDFKNNTTAYDSKLGYISDGNWYLGLLYSYKNYSSDLASTNGSASGAGLGYFFANNFNFRAFYRFDESFGRYRKGSGFQTDFEYKVHLASSFYIGVLISHRQVIYKVNNSITNYQEDTAKETFPGISLGFFIN